MDPVTVKPGYLTTEFWIMLLGNAVAMAVLFGLVPKEEQKSVYDALATAIQNAAALAGSAAMIWKYIKSRAEVKSAVVVAKAAESTVLAADLNMRAATTKAETVARSLGNKSMGSVMLLFLFFCAGSASAADYKLAPGKWRGEVPAGTKVTIVVAADGTSTIIVDPATVVTVTGGGGVVQPPIDPPPVGTQTPFEKQVSKLTSEAIAAGGTPTTGAAISAVYSLVSEAVGKGEVTPEKAVPTVGIGVRLVMTKVSDSAKWGTFRQAIGDQLDVLEVDGSLLTDRKPDKDKYSKALKEVATGMNSVTGFNGSMTEPMQIDNRNAGIFGDINFLELIAIIKALIAWIKTLKCISYVLTIIQTIFV